MPKKTVSKKKKLVVDFGDEDSVKKAMAEALEVDVDELTIKESHLSGFGVPTYQIDHGRKEYYTVENEDEARTLAVAIVKQDLEHDPEIFNQSFIESHIDLDRLRRDLMSDVENMRYEDLSEDAKRKPEQFIKDNGLDWPEPSEEEMRDYAEQMSDEENSATAIYKKLKSLGDAEDRWIEMSDSPKIPDSEIESLASSQAEEQLRDPMQYLEDIYGREDAVKQAIKIAGIDVDAAAEEAVSTDGEGHFLSSYDGNTETGPGGIVYWRHN